MQRFIAITIWILFAVIIQSVLIPDFPSVRIWSDLFFYLIIILGLRFRFATGLIMVVVLGYIADAMSAAPYGVSTVSYLATLIFIRHVRANIFLESRLALFLWVFAFSVFRQVVQLITLSVIGRTIDIHLAMMVWLPVQALWDATLGLILIPLLEKMIFYDWMRLFLRRGLRDH